MLFVKSVQRRHKRSRQCFSCAYNIQILFLSLQKNVGNHLHFVQKYYLQKYFQEERQYLKQFEVIQPFTLSFNCVLSTIYSCRTMKIDCLLITVYSSCISSYLIKLVILLHSLEINVWVSLFDLTVYRGVFAALQLYSSKRIDNCLHCLRLAAVQIQNHFLHIQNSCSLATVISIEPKLKACYLCKRLPSCMLFKCCLTVPVKNLVGTVFPKHVGSFKQEDCTRPFSQFVME